MELAAYKTDPELDVAERGSNEGEKAVSPSGAPSERRSGTQLEVCIICALCSREFVNTS